MESGTSSVCSRKENDQTQQGATRDWWERPAIWQYTSTMSSTATGKSQSSIGCRCRSRRPASARRSWQLTRTGARILAKLPMSGPWQDKVIKGDPQTFADLGPTYVKFGQIIASSPARVRRAAVLGVPGLLDAVPPADTGKCTSSSKGVGRRSS